MLEIIKNKNIVHAIIVRSAYNKSGPNFFTNNKDRLQIGSMVYKKGKKIKIHFHKKLDRKSTKTAEVLFIKKGKIKVSFFCEDTSKLLDEKILEKNDVVLIQEGAHGFEILENIEMIEVKLGPYLEDDRIHLDDK